MIFNKMNVDGKITLDTLSMQIARSRRFFMISLGSCFLLFPLELPVAPELVGLPPTPPEGTPPEGTAVRGVMLGAPPKGIVPPISGVALDGEALVL